MATSKQLTAKVNLNTTQFENKIKRIARSIDALNNAVGKQSNAYKAVNNALKRNTVTLKKIEEQTENVNRKTSKWANFVNNVKSKLAQAENAITTLNKKLKGSNSAFAGMWGWVKRIAGTLLGLQTIKIAIEGADILTGAENRLNNIAHQLYGNAAYTRDANGNITGYSDLANQFTKDAKDKIYVAAQNSRTDYANMMSNVSKTMTLAPSAFHDNIDYAIRFQEIMGKAYAISGATASEMHNSMTQLTQALGAGILAGDELRSVREGAPMAYQAIEKFAQGVLKSKNSLKELAADGLITSEMVVAGVMSMGDSVDQAFALTKWRFADVGTSIKNVAKKAFEPVITKMTDKLNKAIDNGLIKKIEKLFTKIAKGVMIVFEVISRVIKWTADNWNWLKHIIFGALTLYAAYVVAVTAISVKSAIARTAAWIAENKAILKVIGKMAVIVLAVYGLIQVFNAWKTAAIDTIEAIGYALLIIAAVALIFVSWIVALILVIIAIVILFFEGACWITAAVTAVVLDALSLIWNIILYVIQFICAAIVWLVGLIVNVVLLIIKIIASAVMFIYTLIQWVVAFIVNGVMGIWNVICAFCQNIGIAFQNAWNGAASAFWNFIADCIDGLDWLAKPLEAIAELFGKSFDADSFAGNLRNKADSYQQKDYVSIGDAWSKGWNTMSFDSMGGNLSSGWNVVDFVDANAWSDATWNGIGNLHTGYANPLDWGATAMDWGEGVKDAVNEWGSQYQTGDGTLDSIGSLLGLDDDFANMGNFPTNGVSSDYTPDYEKLLGDTADNTGRMADSMELAEEDLDYLRRIADMEWKKEFTTANITIDMTNNNTINNKGDLEGWVETLRDALTEEMNAVANGVYA